MPKLKTHKGTAKRVKITGEGRLRRQRASQGHFLGKKTGATRRLFKQDQVFDRSDLRKIRDNLGL